MIESSVAIGEYFYDGDGKRVKKIAGSEETIFVYDAGGKLIGEYSSIVQTGSNAKTVYPTNDHLGSPRINTDGTRQVISRHDYHPFGEEIARTGYGSDTIRKQFTGYERDNETGLDFATARYYSSAAGRFQIPDPLQASGHGENPQTWNRYSYVGSNPTNIIDPSGLIWHYKENEDGTLSIRWFGKDDTVEDGYKVYFGSFQYRAMDGSGRYIWLNPLGPNPNGLSDFNKKGWAYGSAPVWVQQGYPPAEPGLENVTLDIVLFFDGIRGLFNGLRSAPRFFSKIDSDATTAALRSSDDIAAQIGKNRNLAVADYDIDGVASNRAIAGSGPTQPGTVGAPPDPVFVPSSVGGWKRRSDAEYKIFEYLAGQIGDRNATGNVTMITERIMCSSCASVAEQFRQRYPNINVVVKNGSK